MTDWARQKVTWLRNWRLRYKAGDKGALLDAARWCLQMNTRPPRWVTFEVQAALTRFCTYKAATLDEAFGIEKRAKDARGIARLKRRSEKTGEVMDLVLKAKRDNKALDRELFETIAGELGINKNEAVALWKESQKFFPIPLKHKPPKHKRSSRLR